MPLTIELKILALSVVLGFVHIVLVSHAASLQRGLPLDRERPRRNTAAADRRCGPPGARITKFPRDVSVLRSVGSDRSRRGHPQFAYRMGCPTLFLGAHRLCPS